MSARTMTLMILGLALAVSQLPNTRYEPAAASDGATYATVAATPDDVAPAADLCPPQSEPMTVCTPEGCYTVASAPETSVVRTVSTATAPTVKQSLTAHQRASVSQQRTLHAARPGASVRRSRGSWRVPGGVRTAAVAAGKVKP